MSDGHRALEHEVELDRSGELGVEDPARVVDLDAPESLTEAVEAPGQLGQSFFRAVHAGAFVHRVLHVLADLGDALVAALLVEETCLDALRLVFQQRVDRVGAHRGQRGDPLGGGAPSGGAEHQAFRK